MTGSSAILQLTGYGIAGIAFLVLAVLLLTNFRGRLRGALLTSAAITSMVWAFVIAWSSQPPGLLPLQLFLAEFIHDLAWLVFLSVLIGGAVGAARYVVVRYGGIFLVGGIILLGVGQTIFVNDDANNFSLGSTLILGSLLTALYALVLVEQVYRNARESQRGGLKYLCLGVGAIFAYDLFLYSNAIFVGRVNELFWGVRGFVVAMSVPLIALAAKRSPSWSAGIFVSRHVVFYTATLFGAGIYLIVIGVVGYNIRQVGPDWGPAAQVVFFAAAIIALFLFMFSDRTRRRLRVFISKHFFENRYDYREEWLRLIDTLTSQKVSMPLRKRALKAIVEILDAPSAVLWLFSRESECYHSVTGWNVNVGRGVIDADSSLVTFLAESGWVVELAEYQTDSSRYEGLEIERQKLGIEDPAYIVPLLHDGVLLGFAVLAKPDAIRQFNFEDRDLLKTAGQQVASYLAQEDATEQLTEGRQFEAFNRLTAYLMHDLKNVIAQQSLVVENAEKHKSNPAFIDDAIDTIKGSVRRMQRVMEQLQQSNLDHHQDRVEVCKLILQAVSRCTDREPTPHVHIVDDQIWVCADRDRLLMALYHGIRNSQDATPPAGHVDVKLTSDGTQCSIQIADTGVGMNETFIRERLFKPFDSTKGTQGMGIGAYQIRETVRAMGGEIQVESQPERGTSLVLKLNLAK